VRPARILLLAPALLAVALGGCTRQADQHRAVPTISGTPSFLAQSFDATGTLLVGTPLGVYRSSDGGRTWHTTQRHVWGALAVGFTQASTIVSRGRLLQRGNLSYDRVDAPKRSPFHGGSVLALTWLPGGKLYALVRGTYWHLYVTLDSARTWYPRPALSLPRSSKAIAVARTKGAPDVLYAAAGRTGLWRSVDAGVSWSRLPVKAPSAQSVATSPARWQHVVAALPELSWSDDYGATWHTSGPRATIVASDPRNERIWYAVAPDGELLVSTDGGHSW
jgi:photosystem II stability/assembly factor-like uncharacterized protein